MKNTNTKEEITKSQAINIITDYAEKHISQVKKLQSNYPFIEFTKEDELKLEKAERAIRIVKKLIPIKIK